MCTCYIHHGLPWVHMITRLHRGAKRGPTDYAATYTADRGGYKMYKYVLAIL